MSWTRVGPVMTGRRGDPAGLERVGGPVSRTVSGVQQRNEVVGVRAFSLSR